MHDAIALGLERETKLRPKVWVVDDSALESEIARRALAGTYDVELFSDGSAVLERSATSQLPDVLVLDWIMPDVSGLDVCRFLRSSSDQLPVLLLTAHQKTSHVVEGLAAGANDYLSKPFSPQELVARVGALVAAKRMRERAEHAERERADSERQRADAAEERARLSELYLGIIGHDLRTPLTSITMTAQLIAQDPADETANHFAQRILSSTKRMSEMIAALLDVTRTRLGGGIPIHPLPNRLGDLCQQIVDELAAAYPEREISLVAPADLPLVRCDYDRMSQVVSNLVTNAIQHGSASGPVRVVLAPISDGVELTVHNEGTPIPSDTCARLFDPFRRAVAPRGTSKGLGLGLYISQQIVAAHGGTLTVASGDTTIFAVRLAA